MASHSGIRIGMRSILLYVGGEQQERVNKVQNMYEISLMHRGRLLLFLPLLMVLGLNRNEGEARFLSRRSTSDKSVSGYLTERTCWWNEVCKEEFQSLFRCKCPEWSFCRAPGRYYNAFCSMTATGYIWMQPLFQARNNNQDSRSLSPAIKKK